MHILNLGNIFESVLKSGYMAFKFFFKSFFYFDDNLNGYRSKMSENLNCTDFI